MCSPNIYIACAHDTTTRVTRCPTVARLGIKYLLYPKASDKFPVAERK